MRFVLRGEPEKLDQSVDVASGPFQLRFPVRSDTPLRDPVLSVEHATWSPAEVGTSGDRRILAFSFFAAWFEPAPPSAPP